MAHETSRIVSQILDLTEENRSLKARIETFPISYIKENWDLNSLSNLVEPHLSRSSYTLSEKKLRSNYFRDLGGREVFRIILATNEFLDFHSEVFASFLFEILRTKDEITKRELLQLKFPQQPYLKTLLKQYDKDKLQIRRNEESIRELEKQIDDLVYKLYDITHKERRIIEKYLAKS